MPTITERLARAIADEQRDARPCPDLLAYLGDLKARAEAGEDVEEDTYAILNDLYV